MEENKAIKGSKECGEGGDRGCRELSGLEFKIGASEGITVKEIKKQLCGYLGQSVFSKGNNKHSSH